MADVTSNSHLSLWLAGEVKAIGILGKSQWRAVLWSSSSLYWGLEQQMLDQKHEWKYHMADMPSFSFSPPFQKKKQPAKVRAKKVLAVQCFHEKNQELH